MAGSVKDPIDILIVGGGLSGIVTAYKIQEKITNLNVIIIESKPQLGGQLLTNIRDLLDMGDKWITEDQYHIYNLLRKLNISITRRTSHRSHLNRYYTIDHGIFSKFQQFEVSRFIKEVDNKCLLCRPGKYSLAKRDKTMEDYLCSRLFFEKSRDYIRMFVRLISGVNAKYVTVKEFFITCCSSGGLTPLIVLYTGSSNSLLEFSSDELIEALVSQLNETIILKKTTIREIIHYTDYIMARDELGKTYFTSCLVLAIPWNYIGSINIVPPIPPELRTPILENRYLVTSFVAKYVNNYWTENNYSGSFLSESAMLIGYELRPFVYGGIVLHDENFEMISKPIILQKLSEAYGNEMLKPMVFRQKTFQQSLLLNLPQTTPWNRIIWSSTCSGTHYRGCLSGAVQSGLRAAIHALLILRPQAISWQDINDVQRAGVIRPRYSWFQVKLSSWNLYDGLFYTCLGGTVIILFKFRHLMLSKCINVLMYFK